MRTALRQTSTNVIHSNVRITAPLTSTYDGLSTKFGIISPVCRLFGHWQRGQKVLGRYFGWILGGELLDSGELATIKAVGAPAFHRRFRHGPISPGLMQIVSHLN